jgi:S1-C subfamily serine protease
VTIPDQSVSAPGYGGWLPPGEWQPYQQQYPQHYAPQYPQPPRRRRRTGRVVAAIAGGLAALALAGAGGFAAGWSLHPDSAGDTSRYLPYQPGQPDQQQPVNPGSNGGGQPGAGPGAGSSAAGATDAQVAAVADKVDRALVDIDTELGDSGRAAGTGIVITSDGVVLTNNHVVAGATAISVTDIGDHKTYRAAVVGYDRSNDIAVLRLSGASGLAAATLAESATVKEGDPVVAIGNAGGTGGTPSAVGGAVSALNQTITAQDEVSGSSEQLTGLIEVSADIQAGDSGGPLLTTSGQVIGVDTAASAGFRYQSTGGDGYAIPIATATKIAGEIRAGRSSSTVHIGATAYLGVEVAGNSQGETGPTVIGVVAGTPAASAGLTRGDVIRSVSSTAVDSATALTTALDRYHPGDRITLGWTDLSGQSHSSAVKLATGPVG